MSILPSTPVSAETALQSLRAGTVRAPDAKTADAAKDFEAVFLSEMFSHMFEGIDVDPMFGGGGGEKMFRSMMIQEYGKDMAKHGGIGISDQLQKMMIQMQEKGQSL
ncbi:MAG: rod-binding protein [Alphaproteobacteria bacterium]